MLRKFPNAQCMVIKQFSINVIFLYISLPLIIRFPGYYMQIYLALFKESNDRAEEEKKWVSE